MSISKNENFGAVAKEYAMWRNDFPEVVFDHLQARGVPIAGSRVADIGSGTGILCRLLAMRGADVTGVDPYASMIEEAKAMDAAKGLTIHYEVATAEATGLPEHTFDIVTVLRSWHWFDRPRAVQEIQRLLKPGGYLLVMDSAINPREGGVSQETFELIRTFAPEGVLQAPGSKAEVKQRRNGFPVNWFVEWQDARFQLIDSYQFDYEVSFTHEGWRGRVASLSWVSTFDQEPKVQLDAALAEFLLANHPVEPLVVPHVCSVAILKATC